MDAIFWDRGGSAASSARTRPKSSAASARAAGPGSPHSRNSLSASVSGRRFFFFSQANHRRRAMANSQVLQSASPRKEAKERTASRKVSPARSSARAASRHRLKR